MDAFKFSVCAKTAIQILIMSGVWAGRVQKSMAEILPLSAIQACARLSWKAKNGLWVHAVCKKACGPKLFGNPLKSLTGIQLDQPSPPHTTFLCYAKSWPIFGVKSKLIVFWKPENIAHQSNAVVEQPASLEFRPHRGHLFFVSASFVKKKSASFLKQHQKICTYSYVESGGK